MMKGFYHYWTSLRLLLRLPISYIGLFFYLVAIIVVDIVNYHTNPVQAIFTVKTSVGPFSSCLAMILIIYLYKKDTNHLHYSYPFSFTWALIGNWLSVMTYMSIYAAMIGTVFILNAHLWDITDLLLQNTIRNLIISMELTFALAISLGLIVASIVRNGFAYFISPMILLFTTYILRLPKPYLLPFKTSPILSSKNSEPMWVMMLTHQERAILWYVMAALAFLFFIGALIITVQRRPNKSILAHLLCLLVAVVFASSSFVYHYRYWSHQFSDLKEHHTVATPMAEAGNQPRSLFTITNYQIDMFEDGDMWTINSQLKIEIPEAPIGKTLSFTINPDFHVEQVTINGKIVDYNQQFGWVSLSGNDFNLSTPHQTMSFIYTGQFEEWGITGNGEEKWFAFIQGENFYLPAYLAWYPLPGRVPLYYQESKDIYHENSSSAITAKPVNYTIRLHHMDQPVFSTTFGKESTEHNIQVIQTTNRTGVTLFSGSFKTWESKNVSVVMPDYYDYARPIMTKEVESIRDFLKDTFKKPINGKLIFLPIDPEVITRHQTMANALVLPCNRLNHLTGYGADDLMEDHIIDYFLTGGKILRPGEAFNQTYIQAIKDLYQHEQGATVSGNTREPLVQKVISELDNDNEPLIKKFLRTLLLNQRDPNHPVITKDEWNLTWETIFENGV
jgi:hypothetical protein